jgi:valyl-tRNA synthetase
LELASDGRTVSFAEGESAGEAGEPHPSPEAERYELFTSRLWRTCLHFAEPLLAGVEGLMSGKRSTAETLEASTENDRWISSRLGSTLRATEKLDPAFMGYGAAEVYRFVRQDLCEWYVEMAKPVFYKLAEADQARQAAQLTLANVLVSTLELLSPYLPFCTHEIARHLGPCLGPCRAFGDAQHPASGFAQRIEKTIDRGLESRIRLVQELIETIRKICSDYNIPSGRAVDVVLATSDDASRRAIEAQLDLLQNPNLVRISELVVTVTDSPTDRNAFRSDGGPVGTAEARGVHVYVPLGSVLDIEAEKSRLARKLKRVLGRLGRSEETLQSESFLKKAPPEVVEEQRAKLRELEREADELASHMRRLEP